MAFGWHTLDDEQRRRIMDGIVEGEPSHGPLHLEIHPTNKCNAKCEFCNTEHFRFGEALPWEFLEETILSRAGGSLNHVRLIGGGEPLIHPKTADILDALGKSGISGFDIITNGIQLKRHARGLVENGCDEIFVSLNEPRDDLYARTMRIPAKNFHRVVEGIEAAVEARDALRETRTCRVVVQLFLNDRNLDAIEPFADYARELGIDTLDIRSAYAPLSGNNWERLTKERDDKTFAVLESIIRKDYAAGRNAVRVSLIDEGNDVVNDRVNKLLAELYGEANQASLTAADHERDEYCLMPWYSMTIQATGGVAPCCRLTGRKDKELGNINEMSLSDVWYGEKYRALRRQMRQVMLTRGDMRYSPKRHNQICDFCIERFGCYITFGLADRRFYADLKQRFDAEVGNAERLRAKAEDRAVRAVHKARALAGTR